MNERATWVRVASYRSMLEAEIAVQTLAASEIPAIARAHDLVGVFGPGFQGNIPRGVDLLVPSPLIEEAKEALGIDAEPPPDAAA